MYLKSKKAILELLSTVDDMLRAMEKMADLQIALGDCLAAMSSIRNFIEQEASRPDKSLAHMDRIDTIFQSMNVPSLSEKEKRMLLRRLKQGVYQLKNTLKHEIRPKLNVVFFPYKASMWNSLATVYEAALKDEDCTARVVPVPFYELNEQTAAPKYEGDLFPKDVLVTHYSQYDIEKEKPDIVFVHNIYDQYNTITRLDERYFASNLKKHTDMLVYIPYCTSHYKVYERGEIHSEFSSPSMHLVDKVVVANELVKKGLILNGIPEEKLLLIGSPKIDFLVRMKDTNIDYPKEWDILEGKTTYLLNTGCMFFASDTLINFGRFIWTITTILAASEKNAILWRPHPLTGVSIKRYTPFLEDWFANLKAEIAYWTRGYKGVFMLDESPDYLPAFKRADVFVTAESSLLYEYMALEKRVVYWLFPKLPELNWHKNSLYLGADTDMGIMELVHKFCEGYDPYAKHRKGIANQLFTDISGNCGEHVYKTIKNLVLEHNR